LNLPWYNNIRLMDGAYYLVFVFCKMKQNLFMLCDCIFNQISKRDTKYRIFYSFVTVLKVYEHMPQFSGENKECYQLVSKLSVLTLLCEYKSDQVWLAVCGRLKVRFKAALVRGFTGNFVSWYLLLFDNISSVSM
jgi:hypothetical protein